MRNVSVLWVVLIQWVLALEWLMSGYGKFAKPDFMANIGKTLSTFGSKATNPSYAQFLNQTAVPMASLFGNLTRYGELLGGLALLIGGWLVLRHKKVSNLVKAIVLLALIGLAFMNLNFYLAAGWSSPSTAGINLTMGLIEAILALCYIQLLRES